MDLELERPATKTSGALNRPSDAYIYG